MLEECLPHLYAIISLVANGDLVQTQDPGISLCPHILDNCQYSVGAQHSRHISSITLRASSSQSSL
jgi:hypothetical protein